MRLKVRAAIFELSNQRLAPTLMAMDLPKDPVSLFQLFCPVSLVEEWVGWTNSNVALLLTKEVPPKPLASWHQTTVAEVYIWLAILIYIGIHKEKRVSDYWITPKPGELKLVHPVTKWMTYPRFQQLFQFLRISPPSESNTTRSVERTISQVSRWSEHIQAVSSDLFVPGKHIAIDKCVIRFKAGSRKLGPKGIKAWVVAQEGYFVRWKFDIPDSRPRKQGILARTQTNKHRLAKTQAAVLDLILQLPITSYRVFFDDLFTTPQLLRALRDHGVVSTGAARLNGDIDPPFALVKSQDSRGQVQWKIDGPRADDQVIYLGISPSIAHINSFVYRQTRLLGRIMLLCYFSTLFLMAATLRKLSDADQVQRRQEHNKNRGFLVLPQRWSCRCLPSLFATTNA